ncbi:MAG: hypothetical protein HUU55_07660 [Myxococcales bacterium]|nr:hypothetical protein [Myxococcales bacterium]
MDAHIQSTMGLDPEKLDDTEWIEAAARALFLYQQQCDLLERIIINAIGKSFSR